MPDELRVWTGTPTVVDASVAFKWFDTDEPGADESGVLLAAHSRGDVAMIAPEHFLVEVSHVLRRRRAGEELAGAVDVLYDFNVLTVPLDRELLLDGARIAEAEGLALYDAVYIALAAQLDTQLVTADRRQAATHSCRARLIG